MIEIHPLEKFSASRLRQIASGYTTNEIYRVEYHEGQVETVFRLTLEPLPESKSFVFPFDEEELKGYEALIPNPFCLGAYDDGLWVGVALAEPRLWNNTLWVWEFHVAETYRGKGIGRRLMERLAASAEAAGLRSLICETQNTNVPAIRFYRAVGYRVEGVDISYYTNEDMLPGRTVAVFMKRRLT